MIIENTADPAMINTILLSHLLFINSLSAIIAGAEMKGGGRRRGEVRSSPRRRSERMGARREARGGEERVLISAAVIYILIKSVFGSCPEKATQWQIAGQFNTSDYPLKSRLALQMEFIAWDVLLNKY